MDFIKYKDKTFPFSFTWSAFKEWQANVGDNEVEMFEHGCFLGFKYGAKKQGEQVFKKEEMSEMFDDDTDFQAKTFELFAKQMGKQKKILEAIQL